MRAKEKKTAFSTIVYTLYEYLRIRRTIFRFPSRGILELRDEINIRATGNKDSHFVGLAKLIIV